MEATVAGTNPHPIGGTLVIQPLPGIGDAIWHLPHLKCIAEQTGEKKVSLLTKRRSRADALFEFADFIEEVLWLDEIRHRGPLGGFALGTALSPYKFDAVWILHLSPRYGLAAWRAGIGERIGYGIGWQDAFLTTQHALPRDAKSLHAIGKANRLLSNHSVPRVETVPNLPMPDTLTDSVRTEFEALPRPWVSFAIGASEGFKQWGSENFGALADRLKRSLGGTIFLIGGPGDAEMTALVSSRFSNPDWIVPVIDRPLMETGAVTAVCDAMVGNDTGFLNMAAALGTKSVGLFGGSVPVSEDPRILPIAPPGALRYGSDRMGEISPDEVAAKLLSLVAEK